MIDLRNQAVFIVPSKKGRGVMVKEGAGVIVRCACVAFRIIRCLAYTLLLSFAHSDRVANSRCPPRVEKAALFFVIHGEFFLRLFCLFDIFHYTLPTLLHYHSS